jgi:soluble lytic murein transglycosylase-like protein
MKKLFLAVALCAASPAVAHNRVDMSVGAVRQLVDHYAAQNGVPRRLAHGVIRKESGYDCRAKNPRSTASGAGQLVRATALALGVTDVFDCRQNVSAAMRYLALAIRRGGAGCQGVSLYQAGVGARPRCTAYGRAVMRMAGR